MPERTRSLPWTPLAASVAIHAVLLALLVAPDAGRRTPPAPIVTGITASLAGVRVADDAAQAHAVGAMPAVASRAAADVRRARPAASPARSEPATVQAVSAARPLESAVPPPMSERSAAPAIAPDDDIADAGRYRMVFAFAMRRAVTTDLPATSRRVRVLLAVAFDAAGALAVEVLGSSGSPVLDAQAVGIARAAHAAAPVPARLRGTPMRFEVTVEVAQPEPAVVAG